MRDPLEALWYWLARRTWLARPTRGELPDSAPPIDDELRLRLAIEYPPEIQAEVERELMWYGSDDSHDEVDRVRVAALDLADGDVRDLRLHIRSARNDHRDVLYWAYYDDEIPLWRLNHLLVSLVAAGKLTAAEAYGLRTASGRGNHTALFEGLLGVLRTRGASITRFQMIEARKVAKQLRLPPRALKGIEVVGE